MGDGVTDRAVKVLDAVERHPGLLSEILDAAVSRHRVVGPWWKDFSGHPSPHRRFDLVGREVAVVRYGQGGWAFRWRWAGDSGDGHWTKEEGKGSGHATEAGAMAACDGELRWVGLHLLEGGRPW